jgi:glycosyltransferase involved in cell wall biosynthesis
MSKTSAKLGRELTPKQIKVLYVCPFAHYSGHPPWAAIHEPEALAQAGVRVTLLTSYGIIDNTEVKVPHVTVISRSGGIFLLQRLINFFFTRWALFRWPIMLLANFLALVLAIRLKRKLKYDIIHLRDGDPFLFLPLVLSLPFRGQNWVVSLMGGNLFYIPPPLLKTLRKDLRLFVYSVALKVLNSKLWRQLYRRSLARNNFLFLTQSEAVKRDYDSYLEGVFSGNVIHLPLGFGGTIRSVSKEEARRHLGLPQGKPLFLSFGASHPGKDLEVVFRALKNVPDVFLVQAGKYAFSVGANPAKLAQDYAMQDKVIIRNDYIPEQEKPYYFFAADAVILSYTRQFLSTVSLLWEACHFGTPVIASDNGQLGELVKTFRPGLLFTAQDVASLRKAITRFLGLKPEEIEVFKNNCQKFCQEFSLEKWAQRCLEIYEGVLSSKEQGDYS